MNCAVLVVDDNLDYAVGVVENLALYGMQGYSATSSKQALELAAKYRPGFIFIDLCLGKECGIELLQAIKKVVPASLFVMITGYGTIDTAISSLKLGATDYLQKPVKFDTILNIVSSHTEQENKELHANMFIKTAHSAPMRSIIEKVGKLAPTKLPILLLGENGTGKELVADYIVSLSQSKEKPFIKVNSSAFSESLLENELFGHEKGSYTGASSAFKGVFEQADGGTLFLDEIGDMSLSIQAKILRAIQNNEVRRIGSEVTKTINTRFIAATNKNLQALIAEGSFREDLYYRLNTAQIRMPPLRERRDDIPSISAVILKEHSASCERRDIILSPEVSDYFHSYLGRKHP
ncbi:sigma-54-dependent response regulator transcription factor ZraR [Treponema sp.]